MVKALLKTLNERPVAFHPIYIKITGSIVAGYLLSQILYWYYKQNGEFYKKDEDWIKELYLGVKELRNAKKKLKDLGLIKIKLKGNPAISHYSINEDILISFLTPENSKLPAERAHDDMPKGLNMISPKGQSGCAERDKQDTPKGTNYIYIDTETTTESNNKLLEQSSCSSIGKNKKIIPSASDELMQELEDQGNKGEHGDQKLNWILSFLSKKVGVDEFKETATWQRRYAQHFIIFIDKKGKNDFLNRLTNILTTDFKSQNANSIKYLYSEIKSYIHSPQAMQNDLIENLIKKLPENTPNRKKSDIRALAKTRQNKNKEKTMNSSTASQIVDKIINNKWSNENN